VHGLGLEVALDVGRAALAALELGPEGPDHLRLVPGPLPAQGVALDVLVQVPIGVQLRAVGRQEEQPDLRGARGQPGPHDLRPVHRVAIHDEEDRGSAVPQQAPEKPEEQRHAEPLLEHHERELAPVRDDGEHVAAEPLPRARDHRGLAAPAIRGARLVIGAEPHLVAPVDRGARRFGGRLDGRVLFHQPAPDRRRVLFEPPAERLLRCEPPALQVPADRPDRDGQAEPLRQELLHRLPGPEREGEPELVRAALGDEPDGQGRLVRGQLRAGRPARPLRLQGRRPAGRVRGHPLGHRGPSHPEDPSGLGVSQAVPDRLHGPPPEIRLRCGGQRAGISGCHACTLPQGRPIAIHILL
jgi:hypothetical protein